MFLHRFASQFSVAITSESIDFWLFTFNFWFWVVPRTVCIGTEKCIFVVMIQPILPSICTETLEFPIFGHCLASSEYYLSLHPSQSASPFCTGRNCCSDYDWNFPIHILMFIFFLVLIDLKTMENARYMKSWCIVHSEFSWKERGELWLWFSDIRKHVCNSKNLTGPFDTFKL